MAQKLIKAHILGYPRVGEKRELKFAQESFWRGESSPDYLQKTAQTLRAEHWKKQQAVGLSFVTTTTFLYTTTCWITRCCLVHHLSVLAKHLSVQKHIPRKRLLCTCTWQY